MYKDTLLSFFQQDPWDTSDEILLALFGAIGSVLDSQSAASDTFVQNLSPATANEDGIAQWEKDLGLPSDPTLSLDVRRQRVQVKAFRMNGPLTKASLLALLKNIDVTATVAWGGYVIPISVEASSNATDYDFAATIAAIEQKLPAHLTYSLTLVTPDDLSGYTMYADHIIGQNEIAMQPESGTLYAGRWQDWDVDGEQKSGTVQMASQAVAGSCSFYLAGDLYSGSIVAPSNTSAVMTNTLQAASTAVTGTGSSFPCGVYECGEEVA